MDVQMYIFYLQDKVFFRKVSQFAQNELAKKHQKSAPK